MEIQEKRRRAHGLRKQSLSTGQRVLGAATLILPALALFKACHQWDYRWVLPYFAVVSAAAYIACAADKKKAQAGEWRTPESTLHFFELIGGWPGSFVAQRRFRHKISKASYQVSFWLIILLYQFASVDYINEGKYSAQILAMVGQRESGPRP